MSIAFQFERFLTVDEVGEILKKRRSTVYNLLRSGEIDAIKIGGGNRVPKKRLRSTWHAASRCARPRRRRFRRRFRRES